jgi:hypothetical protein
VVRVELLVLQMAVMDQMGLVAGAALTAALVAMVVLILFGRISAMLLTAPALVVVGVIYLRPGVLLVAPVVAVVAH